MVVLVGVLSTLRYCLTGKRKERMGWVGALFGALQDFENSRVMMKGL